MIPCAPREEGKRRLSKRIVARREYRRRPAQGASRANCRLYGRAKERAPAAGPRLTTPPFKTIPIFRRRALPFTTGRLARISTFLPSRGAAIAKARGESATVRRTALSWSPAKARETGKYGGPRAVNGDSAETFVPQLRRSRDKLLLQASLKRCDFVLLSRAHRSNDRLRRPEIR